MRWLIPLLLACEGDTSKFTPTDGTQWAGWERYRFGTSASVDDLSCDLRWRLFGTSSSQRCAECSFVFDAKLTLEPAASFNDGSCQAQDEQLLTYGLVDDWQQDGPWIGLVTDGSFDPMARASWDPDTATLRYATGNFGTDDSSYYTVDYLEGQARRDE